MRSVPTGLDVRPARREDLPGIHRLIYTYDVEIGGYADFTLEDLKEMTSGSRFDLDRDSWVVRAGENIVGYAMLWNRDPETSPSNCYGVTHPRYFGRGIGSLLVDGLEERQRTIVAEHPNGPPILRSFVDLSDPAAIALIEARGYLETRRHYTMEADVSAVSRPSPPDGFSIRACTLEALPVFHEVLEETFTDHFGHVPTPYEEWIRATYERGDTELDLWLIGSTAGTPAGIMLGRIKDGVGWIDALGVRAPYRKSGLGSALLRTALWMFRARGASKAALGVDASNATGAVALYERAGMHPVRVYLTYEKSFD